MGEGARQGNWEYGFRNLKLGGKTAAGGLQRGGKGLALWDGAGQSITTLRQKEEKVK